MAARAATAMLETHVGDGGQDKRRGLSKFTDPEQTMRAHPFLVALTCVLSLALGSCNTGQGVSNGSTHGSMRLINVIPNAGGPLNVTFDLKPFLSACRSRE